jgi:hypothetical protein
MTSILCVTFLWHHNIKVTEFSVCFLKISNNCPCDSVTLKVRLIHVINNM